MKLLQRLKRHSLFKLMEGWAQHATVPDRVFLKVKIVFYCAIFYIFTVYIEVQSSNAGLVLGLQFEVIFIVVVLIRSSANRRHGRRTVH